MPSTAPQRMIVVRRLELQTRHELDYRGPSGLPNSSSVRLAPRLTLHATYPSCVSAFGLRAPCRLVCSGVALRNLRRCRLMSCRLIVEALRCSCRSPLARTGRHGGPSRTQCCACGLRRSSSLTPKGIGPSCHGARTHSHSGSCGRSRVRGACLCRTSNPSSETGRCGTDN